MPLETGTRIPDLDETNPVTATDPVSEGAAHLQLVKRCVKGSFPAFVGTEADPKEVTLTEEEINDAAKKSADETVSGTWTFEQRVTFILGTNVPNNVAYSGEDTGGQRRPILYVDTNNRTRVGDANLDGRNQFFSTWDFERNGDVVALLTSRGSGSILAYDRGGTAKKTGFRNPTAIDDNSSRTLSQNDEGRVLRPSAPLTYTIPSLESFTTIRIMTIADITLAQDTGINMFLFNGEGPGSGDRTVVAGGVVELYWFNANTVYVFGNGIE